MVAYLLGLIVGVRILDIYYLKYINYNNKKTLIKPKHKTKTKQVENIEN